jgi:hypothetical protein
MTMFLDMILGRQRVLVKANERVLALYRGEVSAFSDRVNTPCRTAAACLSWSATT